MKYLRDISGIKFGRLVALERVRSSKSSKHALWLCLCECGNNSEVLATNLKTGHTRSCGCLQQEVTVSRSTTHGKCYAQVYTTYFGMKQRCINTSDHKYRDYGGRGITVCDRWLESSPTGFENFLEDMGDRPTTKHSIDRIDVNGNYEPSNCRWATSTQQARNKRKPKNNTSSVVGVSIEGLIKKGCRAFWIDHLGIKHSKYFSIDKYGEDVAFALAVAARQTGIKDCEHSEQAYGVNHGKT